jgi:ribosomal protein S18 acetylase RimI-like enzyme
VTANPLDNPVWHSLTSQHAALAIMATGAAKYPPAVAPFAAVGDAPDRAARQLASLVEESESVYLVGVAPEPPAGWMLEQGKPCLQMICHAPPAEIPGPPVTEMSELQRDDMLALTALVFPGFFRPRTLEMGRYLGIYDGKRLAAMAGERMRLDGFQEISAVCTHPDYSGRHYAQRLVSLVSRGAFERGFVPFLHVYHDNARAIAVYRQLGFADRRNLPLWSLHKASDD